MSPVLVKNTYIYINYAVNGGLPSYERDFMEWNVSHREHEHIY